MCCLDAMEIPSTLATHEERHANQWSDAACNDVREEVERFQSSQRGCNRFVWLYASWRLRADCAKIRLIVQQVHVEGAVAPCVTCEWWVANGYKLCFRDCIYLSSPKPYGLHNLGRMLSSCYMSCILGAISHRIRKVIDVPVAVSRSEPRVCIARSEILTWRCRLWLGNIISVGLLWCCLSVTSIPLLVVTGATWFVRTWYCICPMATPEFVSGKKSVNHPIPFIDSECVGGE